jgi:amidohydrolase
MTTANGSVAAEMTAWRHDLHAHPEFGFETTRTAAFVADKLRGFGLDEVVEGIGRVGVVGTLRRGSARRVIALRADMDALRIKEMGSCKYRSLNPGLMHACGHDGHTAMLLGVAKILASEGEFDGTSASSFSPPESGGRARLRRSADGGGGQL